MLPRALLLVQWFLYQEHEKTTLLSTSSMMAARMQLSGEKI
jgi:hypothetical protein